MKRYSVVEVFATLQGEGYWAGTPAVFVRFAGCNLWSGHDDDRDRDSKRHGASCPLWCDTDFRKGATMSAEDIAAKVRDAANRAGMRNPPMVVFTGGEPLLQLDWQLTETVRAAFEEDVLCAVETNGTVAMPEYPPDAGVLDWVTVSPKVPVERMVLREGSELKVVYPDYDPCAYESLAEHFPHLFVSPQANVLHVGRSLLVEDRMRAAAEFCMKHPTWRLSVQQHKVVGLP